MAQSLASRSSILLVLAPLMLVPVGCGSSSTSDDPDARTQGGDGGSGPDATDPNAPDAGPCTPGAASLICSDSSTLSLCTEDTNFDGTSDGPPTTVQLTCKSFFRDVGEASCEPFDSSSNEALCTMDEGGPCGVVPLIGGRPTVARCTADDAVCMVNSTFTNYHCTTGTGVSCSPSGFEAFCQGDLRVLDCIEDGDGTPQAYVDDCDAVGGGTCDATSKRCVDIQVGGRCSTAGWDCADGLSCMDIGNGYDECVAP